MLLCGLAGPLAAGCAARRSPPAPAAPQVVETPAGYGVRRGAEATGAITSVPGEEAALRHAVRVEELLRGRVAGVQVLPDGRGGFSVRIRGAGGILTSGEPLYVVDGMPMTDAGFANALAGIAPQDVARIDVLKDAASTSIYGSRGANGVIVITTRRRRATASQQREHLTRGARYTYTRRQRE